LEDLLMMKPSEDFTAILLREEILSADELTEAKLLSSELNPEVSLPEAIVMQGYATAAQVARALAAATGMQLIDPTELTIPCAVIDLIPEGLARACSLLPLAECNGALKVAVSDPADVEMLKFVLNRDIQPVLASRDQIIEAINRHYGEAEDC
jgi:type IV pilus assembly protein PilB